MSVANTSMEGNGDIRPHPGLFDNPAGRAAIIRPSPGLDEDDSSHSSSGTDLFDRNPTKSIVLTDKFALDINGFRQRNGGSESATSTALSSMSPSFAAHDITPAPSRTISIARKRSADGTVKSPPLNHQHDKPRSTPQPPKPAQSIPQTQRPSTKRRGRPSTDRSNSAGFMPRLRRASNISSLDTSEVRPRSSIPSRIPVDVFASECIEAAYASRLNPYALHVGEHNMLVDLLMSKEVTIYLNIRNAILRLWTRNPLCSITAEEAAGCAKESRLFGLAEVAYKWLIRNGYINFGCIQVPSDGSSVTRAKKDGKQKTVVVIGAGVSGLTAARQLEGLFAQESSKWTDLGERTPRVVVMEGRKRIGGRVYSKQLRSQVKGSLPDNLRNTAEMGAMIVTGFEHGNPLDIIIRGQLGLRYHIMRDALTIHDTDGQPVDEDQDMLNTELYTDISDRAGDFRAEPQKLATLEGDTELINRCRDPAPDGFTNFQLEPLFDPLENVKHKPAARRGRRRNAPPGTEKLTGRTRVIEPSNATQSAARAAKSMGWELKDDVPRNQTVSLHRVAHASAHPTLGSVMDEAIKQYQTMVDMTPQDMRLLNWHHANLEYANAAPVSSLSLSGHDQDTGNEFEGAHSEIIGGYTQLPRGLLNLPTKLDVRLDRVVESIHYNDHPNAAGGYSTKIVCTDGEVLEADEIVMTTPLGVLKSNTIDFDPPLPSWKKGAIDRMGFGLLNKVVLLYDQPFWDDSRDMFGLLNEAEREASLNPADYARKRGRFYLIWNASQISGRPMLVALMAGNAAHDVETTPTDVLLAEINGRMRTVFTEKPIPAPLEVIVTRWKKDPFSRGTYSFVGPRTRAGDYDLMAQPVGNLHFAGEATCGTHPATVHGAFLSGLRVAADVMESMVGPINLPNPLVKPATIKQRPSTMHAKSQPTLSHKQEPILVTSTPSDVPPVTRLPSSTTTTVPPTKSVCATDPTYWALPTTPATTINSATATNQSAALINAKLASLLPPRPVKPGRPNVNPFIAYTRDKWAAAKASLTTGADDNSNGSSSSATIRATLGAWWRAASDDVKKPYVEEAKKAQEEADRARQEFEVQLAAWEKEAREAKRKLEELESGALSEVAAGVGGEAWGVSSRKTNVSGNIALDRAL